jgi:drug/metabolite transporter (DMT)-like permease
LENYTGKKRDKMFYLPIIGSFLEAAGMTIEKIMLKTKSLNFKNYTVYGFLTITILMLPLLFFFWNIKPEAYSIKNILLLLFVIICALFANLLTYYALKRENLSAMEPIRLMQPIFTIILAILIYPSERTSTFVIILGIIASLTLILSHIKKHHLKYDKYIIAALLGSLFFAIELIASKPLLDYYNSITFYFLRCLGVLLITIIIFRPKNKVDNKIKLTIILTNAMWIIYRIILYYGYANYGIVFTTILFIVTPVFTYIFASIFLKEKITLKQIIATSIILACVAAAIIINH